MAKYLKHWKVFLTIVFGALTLATFAAPVKWSPDFFAPFNLYRLAVMLIFVILILSSKEFLKPFQSVKFLKFLRFFKFRRDLFTSFKKSMAEAPRSAKILSIAVPLVVLICVMIQVLWPEFAAWLIRCDRKSECGLNFRHAIFVKVAFQLVAAVIFATFLYKFAKKKQLLPAVASFLLIFVLIMMAGEELSWGQRIFGWETPADYAQINKQGETNLHNLATNLFQNTLYFGGWLLLVALPFFRDNLKKFLAKFKSISFLGEWIPPAYFILIFAAIYGLVDPIVAPGTGVRFSSILFTILGTAAILIYLIIPARKQLAERVSFTLGVFAIALFFNLLVPDMWDVNAGTPTEYLETFISFGIMWWAIDLRRRLFSISQRDH
ncbi:hypothetical protein FWG95_04370 [Candidatus Saccharibacteria bacterium]|nr:hypothetical protein [Candidatus Saccharibacteria bacterium]